MSQRRFAGSYAPRRASWRFAQTRSCGGIGRMPKIAKAVWAWAWRMTERIFSPISARSFRINAASTWPWLT